MRTELNETSILLFHSHPLCIYVHTLHWPTFVYKIIMIMSSGFVSVGVRVSVCVCVCGYVCMCVGGCVCVLSVLILIYLREIRLFVGRV